jgi:hypothetical protein
MEQQLLLLPARATFCPFVRLRLPRRAQQLLLPAASLLLPAASLLLPAALCCCRLLLCCCRLLLCCCRLLSAPWRALFARVRRAHLILDSESVRQCLPWAGRGHVTELAVITWRHQYRDHVATSVP